MHFPLTIHEADSLTIKFRYTFPISPLGDSLLLLDRGNRWYPLISDQIAKMKLKCEVPHDYTVLSAGDLIEMKTSGVTSQFVWQTKIPIFKLPLVVFKSSSLKKDYSEILQKKIVIYSSATDTLSTASILNEARSAFTFFADLIGKYPHECLTLVEIPYFDGIDISSGLLMVGSTSLKGMEKAISMVFVSLLRSSGLVQGSSQNSISPASGSLRFLCRIISVLCMFVTRRAKILSMKRCTNQ